MNAVEIGQAISALSEQPFNAQEFPFAFLQAFGNKETTIKRLRAGVSNKSDLGGVLQTGSIHIAASPPGAVTKTLAALKASPATVKATPLILFTAEDVRCWLSGTMMEAMELQKPAPEKSLVVLPEKEKEK